MNPLIQLKTTPRLLITLTLLFVCFGLLPNAQAVVPAPDGGYPNFTTAEGTKALQSLTTGSANTAVGWYSLFSDTTGSFNTAVGAGALALSIASNNTATGAAALLLNTTGNNNTANGVAALVFNTTGSQNEATGAFALYNNTVGSANTASGFEALDSNSTGNENIAIGLTALFNNTTGNNNTASGVEALFGNTTGLNNTGIGIEALRNNTTGSSNTAIGDEAGINASTGSGNVYIGAGMSGVFGESNACYIASIDGQTSASGVAVLINSNGKLGTTTSSRRFKQDIKPMDNASEALFALQPVTFRYKKELDPQGIQQWGLVAEDVQRVNPALVALDKQGRPYSVRYDQVNAMLLNEFLKAHSRMEEQEGTIRQLKEKLEANAARQQKQIEALTAGLQKVSAQLEASKPAPQVVNSLKRRLPQYSSISQSQSFCIF